MLEYLDPIENIDIYIHVNSYIYVNYLFMDYFSFLLFFFSSLLDKTTGGIALGGAYGVSVSAIIFFFLDQQKHLIQHVSNILSKQNLTYILVFLHWNSFDSLLFVFFVLVFFFSKHRLLRVYVIHRQIK